MSANKLCQNSLRISFFRLHSYHEYETGLIEKLKQQLGGDRIIFFDAFGHYDKICIYESYKDHKLLFSGKIDGIKSFSTIECICWYPQKINDIINKLKNTKFVSINIFALKKAHLFKSGGLRNDIVKSKLTTDHYYLNSFAWGEQIVLRCSNNMTTLIDETSRFNKAISDNVYEIRSIIGVYNNKNESYCHSSESEADILFEDIILEWNIELIIQSGALQKFNRAVNFVAEKTQNNFVVMETATSLSGSEIRYKISGKNWKSIRSSIKEIRLMVPDLFITTRLRILSIGKTEDENDSLPDTINNNAGCNNKIYLDEEKCQRILSNLGDRVAKTVIHAVYTVTNALNDYPSCIVVESLVPAVNELIYIATEGFQALAGNRDKNKIIRFMLSDSENILRTTRQRISGIPITRELSKLSFELPPPNVRLYIETCEFVTGELLKILSSTYKPYIIIDSMEGPQHSYLAIKLPEHMLREISVYVGLYHEAFHSFITHSKIIINNDKLNKYIEIPESLSPQSRKKKIIEEMIVELLNYNFTYLEDYESYMRQTWKALANYFSSPLNRSLMPQDLLKYLLRTFIIKL